MVRAQWAISGVGGRKGVQVLLFRRKLAAVGLVAADCWTARGLVNLKMLPITEKSGICDFVIGTQNRITEDQTEEFVINNLVMLMISWINLFYTCWRVSENESLQRGEGKDEVKRLFNLTLIFKQRLLWGAFQYDHQFEICYPFFFFCIPSLFPNKWFDLP